MKLYLVRHGESDNIGSDDERSLSTKGQQDIERLANFISSLHLPISHVFQSQKSRAQQTAMILTSNMSVKKGIETKVELEPLAPVENILEEILSLNDDVILVGHMPFLGKLVSKLVTGNENKDVVAFKTGSMICLEKVERDQWVICWMLNSDLFH